MEGGQDGKLTRREFLKLTRNVAAGAVGAVVANQLGLDTVRAHSSIPPKLDNLIPPPTEPSPPKEAESQALSRKEHFKPFNRGNAEWQYVAFQYEDDQNNTIGITTSISELTNPSNGRKMHQLLVMKHNLTTGVTEKHTYNGTRTFDENSSSYGFTEDTTSSQIASFSYNEQADNYQLQLHTLQFNSDSIDPTGLTLEPLGNLIPVSKDGNFTVARYPGGAIKTNYYADHIRIKKSNGEAVGYGRRDSENLEVEGGFPIQLDIDHTWVHASAVLPGGKRAFITAWNSKTGGDFRFADMMVINSSGEIERFEQYNEEDPDFTLSFLSAPEEFESRPGQTRDTGEKMAHGGKVIAKLREQELFTLNIDGNPGQTIDQKGLGGMIEAHGNITSGSIVGIPVNTDVQQSAMWETTTEGYVTFIPLVNQKQE